mgnify:CR=1 FL=1
MPSLVLKFAIVGFAVVLQQTPLAVTGAPPSEVMFPPLIDVEEVIADILEVIIVGKTAFVEKVISSPYDVPIAFVVYDLT